MATFQEVKAFIDDKIKDNENGEITGDVLNEALNLLLGTNDVHIGEEAPTDDGAKLWVDTDDESGETSGGNGGGTSGGSGVATIYMGMGALELTPEQISHNIKVHEVFMDCYNNGGVPLIPQLVLEMDGTLFSAYYPFSLMFDTTPIFMMPDGLMIALMEDGTTVELE